LTKRGLDPRAFFYKALGPERFELVAAEAGEKLTGKQFNWLLSKAQKGKTASQLIAGLR